MFWIAFSAALPSHASSARAAMKFDGWQRLNAEYAKQFGIEPPSWAPPDAAKG